MLQKRNACVSTDRPPEQKCNSVNPQVLPGPGEADGSNDTDQPEHEDDHHNASNRNGKVHTNLLREPSILVMLRNWSSGTWSKASGRATVELDQMRTRFLYRSRLQTLHRT